MYPSALVAEAFALTAPPANRGVDADTTRLFASKKGKKLSMAEKRKKRGKRLPPRQVPRPLVLDETDRVDAWDKTAATDERVAEMKEDSADSAVQAKAAELIEAQMKSVKTLTHIKECVEALPYAEVAEALRMNDGGGYFVKDDFLGNDVASEMEAEGPAMLENNKLELDVTNLGSGEYVTKIEGGDQYTDCPRSVEYVVCLTRHMPPLLDAEGVSADCECTLDDAASMAGITTFLRKAKVHSAPPERPFGFANGGDVNDSRKVTVLYFLTPTGWAKELGGGVAFRADVNSGEEVVVEARKDRLVIFRSDKCNHKMLGWTGENGKETGSCIVTHLVKKT